MSIHVTRPGDLIVSDELARAAFRIKVKGFIRRYVDDKRQGRKTKAQRQDEAFEVLFAIIGDSLLTVVERAELALLLSQRRLNTIQHHALDRIVNPPKDQ